MYTLPMIIGACAWFIATVLNISCNTRVCKKSQSAFTKVYLFIFISLAILAYKNFKGALTFLKQFSSNENILKEDKKNS